MFGERNERVSFTTSPRYSGSRTTRDNCVYERRNGTSQYSALGNGEKVNQRFEFQVSFFASSYLLSYFAFLFNVSHIPRPIS